MEYKGLNLMDEVGTAEIALDEGRNTIHVFDTNHIVEPEYHFFNKSYILSDGFAKLAEVLMSKHFFAEKREMELAEWIGSFTWQFYSSNQTVKTYKKGEFTIIPAAALSCKEESALIQMGLYPKYVKRLD
ncbi:MAG: aminopeptidase [Lysinibacillus sp.]